jgi:hypothetical protein
MEQEDMRIVWAAGVEWMVKRQDDQYVHRPEGDYMASGDQESLLTPMKPMWTMCLRGDQAEFSPIGNRRWQHTKAQPHEKSGSFILNSHFRLGFILEIPRNYGRKTISKTNSGTKIGWQS